MAGQGAAGAGMVASECGRMEPGWCRNKQRDVPLANSGACCATCVVHAGIRLASAQAGAACCAFAGSPSAFPSSAQVLPAKGLTSHPLLPKADLQGQGGGKHRRTSRQAGSSSGRTTARQERHYIGSTRNSLLWRNSGLLCSFSEVHDSREFSVPAA